MANWQVATGTEQVRLGRKENEVKAAAGAGYLAEVVMTDNAY